MRSVCLLRFFVRYCGFMVGLKMICHPENSNHTECEKIHNSHPFDGLFSFGGLFYCWLICRGLVWEGWSRLSRILVNRFVCCEVLVKWFNAIWKSYQPSLNLWCTLFDRNELLNILWALKSCFRQHGAMSTSHPILMCWYLNVLKLSIAFSLIQRLAFYFLRLFFFFQTWFLQPSHYWSVLPQCLLYFVYIFLWITKVMRYPMREWINIRTNIRPSCKQLI